MLVSHTYRFIFLKPPKTAGTSVELWLEPLCAAAGHVPQHSHPTYTETTHGIIGARVANAAELGHPYWNHMPAELLRERVGPATFDSYRKIATVRNPFDRAVSAFHQMALPQRLCNGLARQDIIRRFRDWVAAGEAAEFAIVPMLTVGGNLCTDLLIHFERLESAATVAAAAVGANPAVLGPLPQTKQHTRVRGIPLDAYFSPATERRIVADLATDFELLGYSKRAIDAVAHAANTDGPPHPGAIGDQEPASGNISKEHEMSDDLIYAVFKELAVVEGKRKPDGTWTDANASDVQRILARAFAMVQRASNPNVPGKEDKA